MWEICKFECSKALIWCNLCVGLHPFGSFVFHLCRVWRRVPIAPSGNRLCCNPSLHMRCATHSRESAYSGTLENATSNDTLEKVATSLYKEANAPLHSDIYINQRSERSVE